MSTKTSPKSKKVAAKSAPSIVEEEIAKSVGVRELRQHASRVLDLVKHGERIIVTERGAPIAEIIPIKKDKLQILVDLGAITPATRKWDPELWYNRENASNPNALEEFLKERHEAKY